MALLQQRKQQRSLIGDSKPWKFDRLAASCSARLCGQSGDASLIAADVASKLPESIALRSNKMCPSYCWIYRRSIEKQNAQNVSLFFFLYHKWNPLVLESTESKQIGSIGHEWSLSAALRSWLPSWPNVACIKTSEPKKLRSATPEQTNTKNSPQKPFHDVWCQMMSKWFDMRTLILLLHHPINSGISWQNWKNAALDGLVSFSILAQLFLQCYKMLQACRSCRTAAKFAQNTMANCVKPVK